MKLAFLALSGVRCYDAELMALGLTLPSFVERSQVIASLPSLGLLTLAGMCDSRFEVSYHEVADINTFDWQNLDCEVALISSFTAMIKDAWVLSANLRSKGVTTIMGGLHVSLCPQEARDKADCIVIGEGESVFERLLDDLYQGRLQAVYDARGLNFDFARSPMPRYSLLDIANYNRLTIQTQRGCPYNCEFCASSIRLSPRYKTKPIERIAAELEQIEQMWPNAFIELADDNTFADRKHAMRVAGLFANYNMRWFTESDISFAEDPALLQALAKSGCAQVLVGLESPQPNQVEHMELKSNFKARQLGKHREAVRKIQDAGISVNGCFVLGLDGCDSSSFARLSDYIEELGLYEVQLTIMTPFPGTPLYQRLKGQGRILGEADWQRCTLFDVTFQPSHMSVDELRRGFAGLIGEVYDAKRVKARRRGFLSRQNELRLLSANQSNMNS